MKKKSFFALTLVAALVVAGGCGGGEEGKPGSPRVLSTEEARELLLELPYRYKFREVESPEGASGALAGTVIGKHQTVVQFGIALGTEAEAVPVPEAGVRDPYYYGGGGFVFNDNLIVPGGVGKGIETRAQWREAVHMLVEMEEKLCKASTGEWCPI